MAGAFSIEGGGPTAVPCSHEVHNFVSARISPAQTICSFQYNFAMLQRNCAWPNSRLGLKLQGLPPKSERRPCGRTRMQCTSTREDFQQQPSHSPLSRSNQRKNLSNAVIRGLGILDTTVNHARPLVVKIIGREQDACPPSSCNMRNLHHWSQLSRIAKIMANRLRPPLAWILHKPTRHPVWLGDSICQQGNFTTRTRLPLSIASMPHGDARHYEYALRTESDIRYLPATPRIRRLAASITG